MKIHSKFPIVALAAISVITTASAATIYSDSLSVADTVLNGSIVDSSAAFAGGTSGAAWTAATGINETAAGAALPTNTMAFLPITITAGNIYTLQATMTNVGGGWGALGFSNNSTTNGAWHTTGNKYAWALLRPAGDPNPTNASFAGPGTDNPDPSWASADFGTQTMTITLDTTNAFWSTYASINGVNSATFTYTTNPADITHVGFGVQSATSEVSNFSLTAVPEPSVALLGGLGVLALLRRRRA